MTYTATQLITNAYYLTGIVSRDLQTISGSQLNDGLYLLNELLDVKSANTRLIPYFTKYSLTLVLNQEQYFVPNLIETEVMNFYIDTVRYQMFPLNRRAYFGSARVENIQSLPFNYHVERTLGGSNVFVYFFPSAQVTLIPAQIWGKFGLTDVTFNQDLSLTYDKFYIAYLRYALGDYICGEYNITLQPQALSRLKQLEQIISDISPVDLTIGKLSMFGGDGGLNWGDVNIGDGMRPVGS